MGASAGKPQVGAEAPADMQCSLDEGSTLDVKKDVLHVSMSGEDPAALTRSAHIDATVAKFGTNHFGVLPDHLGQDVLPGTANRNGTWQSTMFHNVTAMVGAGVLGLPNTLIYLGWSGGMIVLVAALVISWYTFYLLVNMHEVPNSNADVEKPGSTHQYMRMDRYTELSHYALGPRWGWIIQPFQVALLWGTATVYMVGGGSNLQSTAVLGGVTDISLSKWIVIFGSASIIVAQVRNFGELAAVSLMGALVTAGYTMIAVGDSARYPTMPRSNVSYATAVGASPLTHVMGMFNALTTVMFAFGGHNIALEIQATLPGGTCAEDSTVDRMMLGVHVAFIYAGLVYFAVTIVGWWAFGNAVTGNIISSLHGAPWVRQLAHMLVVFHVIASFQIYSFPLYDMMEGKMLKWGIHINWWKRVIVRTAYVALTALIACLIPFFGDLMGLIGAVAVTPTTYVFPCILWIILRKPQVASFDFWACWFIVPTISMVGVLGTIGSIYSIVQSSSGYATFSR